MGEVVSPRELRYRAVRHRGRLEKEIVHVAPGPILARLEAPDHGVLGSMKVLRGMFIRRAVAASYVPAGKTQSQMDPLTPALKTVLAPCRRMRLNGMKLRNVIAALCHSELLVRLWITLA